VHFQLILRIWIGFGGERLVLEVDEDECLSKLILFAHLSISSLLAHVVNGCDTTCIIKGLKVSASLQIIAS
jgi:hypothetical protein